MTARDSANDLGAFLSVIAALLLDNVLRLEETASRVTELVMSNCRPDKEFIVTLQRFDRLKQEFEALGEALTRYAQSTKALSLQDETCLRLGIEAIAGITVADLKDRMLRRLQHEPAAVAAPAIPEALAAEVDVDVEF